MKCNTCSGALIFAKDTERFLFLHRTRSSQPNTWGIVGGTIEQSETAWIALKREIQEEIGEIEIVKSIPLETFVSRDKKFYFYTYMCLVDKEFRPSLNDEHNGYAWVEYTNWPKPLHYGLRNTLSKKVNCLKIETVLQTLM